MKEEKCTLVYTGDGGASEGDFHEAVNTAAVWNLPVIIVVENNQWGLSTPSREQFRCKSFADKGIGYGIEAHSINGNNILEVYQTFKNLAESIRKNPRPILVECNTLDFAVTKKLLERTYYPEGMIEEWTKQDPISNYEQFLLSEGILTQNLIEEIKNPIKNKLTKHLTKPSQNQKSFRIKTELEDVYAPFDNQEILPQKLQNREIRFIDAISEAIEISMKNHPNLGFDGTRYCRIWRRF
ncbi:MAG: thiamine pyrophosphate-dependent enzyme [Cloacibacterium normanense]